MSNSANAATLAYTDRRGRVSIDAHLDCKSQVSRQTLETKCLGGALDNARQFSFTGAESDDFLGRAPVLDQVAPEQRASPGGTLARLGASREIRVDVRPKISSELPGELVHNAQLVDQISHHPS
jgi:hypothetical protein